MRGSFPFATLESQDDGEKLATAGTKTTAATGLWLTSGMGGGRRYPTLPHDKAVRRGWATRFCAGGRYRRRGLEGAWLLDRFGAEGAGQKVEMGLPDRVYAVRDKMINRL
jgi:hypothetical protein